MTDEPPRRRLSDLPPRPSRRQGDNPGEPARVRQRRLVRYIAGDPDLLAWLATSKARTLHEVAADLVAAGLDTAAERIRWHADRMAAGEVSPLGSLPRIAGPTPQRPDQQRPEQRPEEQNGAGH